jgi:Fic family protein
LGNTKLIPVSFCSILAGIFINLLTISFTPVYDYLKAAAYLHARFEHIHPFADGNGRVGRTLTNYYLMIHSNPPLIVYEEDKQLYYECLQKYDKTEDIDSLYEFFKYETEKSWKNALELSFGSKKERKGLSDFMQNK